MGLVINSLQLWGAISFPQVIGRAHSQKVGSKCKNPLVMVSVPMSIMLHEFKSKMTTKHKGNKLTKLQAIRENLGLKKATLW